MYKLVLISKYLRRKLAPMFAALAVMLCTMMVIIVISVMGGFLDLLRSSVREITGDVIVDAGSYTGFTRYQELIDAAEALPEVEAATPIIRSYGLINFNGQVMTVAIEGIRPTELDKVVKYNESLHWNTQDLIDDFDRRRAGRELEEWEVSYRQRLAGMDLEAWGMSLEPPAEQQARDGGTLHGGTVIGIEVSPFNQRDNEGNYSITDAAIGRDVALTVLPVTDRGMVSMTGPQTLQLAVLNEYKSGLYEVDANTVFVPFELLQKRLEMDAAQKVDDFGEPTGEQTPPRATQVIIKTAWNDSAGEYYSADDVAFAVDKIVQDLQREHRDMPPWVRVRTWEQRHKQILSAVENEKGLVTFLFAFIGLVAVVFVAVTFWLIVVSKTRDIGVLRAIGASRAGIMGVFLGYGLAIGIVGSLLGLLGAVLIVTNLNGIQEWLYAWFGWRMWNPQTYYFDRIPDTVNPYEVTVIVLCAILASVLGALIPAIRAAWQRPVDALRYE